MAIHIVTHSCGNPIISFKQKSETYRWAKLYAPDGYKIYKVELS